VEYFGQSYPGGVNCGACDWCLHELERIEEPVVIAQKILSCVARVGQRFGVGHVTAVLHGDATEGVRARGHHGLSTFALLEDSPPAEIRGYIDQLTQAGLLARTGEQYPTLQLTTDGVALLRGVGECVLYRQPRALRHARTRAARRGAPTAATASLTDGERRLFDALRELRLELARERHVPPYVIFHDTTLQHLARLRPTTHAALREVPGVGEKKAESLGDRVLGVIRRKGGAMPE
jgi:ATP-dependent DNA helicase RecQ